MSKGFGQQLYLLQYHILHQIKERMMTRIEPQDSLGIFKKCPTLVTSLLSFTVLLSIDWTIDYSVRYPVRVIFLSHGFNSDKKNQKLNQFFGSRTSVVRYFWPLNQCFGPGFFPDPDRTFFLSPDRPKIQIQSGKSGSMKKINKLKVQVKFLFHI